jgi:hypothetical protein
VYEFDDSGEDNDVGRFVHDVDEPDDDPDDDELEDLDDDEADEDEQAFARDRRGVLRSHDRIHADSATRCA